MTSALDDMMKDGSMAGLLKKWDLTSDTLPK
jgi:hypothetical protein